MGTPLHSPCLITKHLTTNTQKDLAAWRCEHGPGTGTYSAGVCFLTWHRSGPPINGRPMKNLSLPKSELQSSPQDKPVPAGTGGECRLAFGGSVCTSASVEQPDWILEGSLLCLFKECSGLKHKHISAHLVRC